MAAAVALASVAVAFMLRWAEAQSDFTPAIVTCAVYEKVNGVEVTVPKGGSTTVYDLPCGDYAVE